MGNKLTHRRPAIEDCYTRPQGLYPSRDVDHRKLRRLILDSKLAPCYPGGEEPAVELEECPICFLHYPSLNRSKCCTKGICTECFLQMKSPNITRPTQCPYCKMANYSVEYRGPKSMEEKGVEQAEEQKVIEAKIRIRQKELQDDEEREQRRDDVDQDSRPPPPAVLSLPVLTPPSHPEQDSWRTARESLSHPPQGPLSSARLSEISVPAVEPDLLWVRGSQQSAVDDEPARARQQQAMPALVSNTLPSAVRHHDDIHGLPTPQPPPGAQLTSRAPNFGFSRHNRDDDFDLDLEDIMVMEAIWLSIQEQGAQNRYTDDELHIAALPRSLSTLMTDFGLGSEAETDLGAITQLLPSLPPPFLPLLPPSSVLDTQEQALRRRSSVTGGLAGAIAALAERQVAGCDTSTQQAIHTGLPPRNNPDVVSQREEVSGTNQECRAVNGEEEHETASPSEPFHRSRNGSSSPVFQRIGHQMVKDSASGDERGMLQQTSPMVDFSNSERGTERASPIRDSGRSLNIGEGLANWVSSTQREYDRAASSTKWSSGDQSSEQVEVGTSFSSSIPSASELPWEAPDFLPNGRSGESSSSRSMEAAAGGGKSTVLPESYEEQMMLAMALSLADAQARIG